MFERPANGPESDAPPNPIGATLRRICSEVDRLKRRMKPVERFERPERIGIPRAFYHYEFPRLFETFFTALGIEPVVSGRTTRRTVECGGRVSEAEHCLPNKLFDAHVEELLDKVDVVFVPRVLSTLKGHIECPKLGALPDAVRADLGDRARVLTVDVNEDERPLRDTLLLLGRMLGCERPDAERAADEALAAMQAARARRDRSRRTPGSRTLLLIGHPYTLHDPFVSGPVVRKLDSMGVAVEMIADDGEPVPASFVRWGASNRVLHRLESVEADSCAGVVQLTCFNCGCDSMMTEIFRETLRDRRVPFMTLVLDEHTATAGLDTRLEAFVDSQAWRTA